MSFAEANRSIWSIAYNKLIQSNKLDLFLKQSKEFILKNCYAIVNINGINFEEFTNDHQFIKPNDIRGKLLIDHCAKSLVEKFKPHILLSYGFSDQFCFVINKSTNFCERNLNDILSLIVSNFTSNYVFNWNNYFDNKLKCAPSFRGNTLLLPSEDNLIKYIITKQHECYITNLNATLYSALIGEYKNYDLNEEQLNLLNLNRILDFKNIKLINLKSNSNISTKIEALNLIKNKINSKADINEYLFKHFNINYNNELELFKKGTLIYYDNSNLKLINTKLKDNFLIEIINK